MAIKEQNLSHRTTPGLYFAIPKDVVPPYSSESLSLQQLHGYLMSGIRSFARH